MPPGAYCDARIMPAAQVCPLPDGISFEEGAAIMLQGMTVEYLFHRVWPIEAGDKVLFHAAAGGVGLLACQWAKSEGIEMIGTAGTDEKCRLALDNGAAHCINYQAHDFVPEVKKLTDDKGVSVVMDGVGKDTFAGSLDCLKPLGMMISFGNASGPVEPVSLLTLASKGSLKLTRTTLFTFLADHDRCQAMAKHLFSKVESGAIKVRIGQTFPLEQIVDAHRALEGRQTTGSTIMTL
jgi:NADPH2:quinone reductase